MLIAQVLDAFVVTQAGPCRSGAYYCHPLPHSVPCIFVRSYCHPSLSPKVTGLDLSFILMTWNRTYPACFNFGPPLLSRLKTITLCWNYDTTLLHLVLANDSFGQAYSPHRDRKIPRLCNYGDVSKGDEKYLAHTNLVPLRNVYNHARRITAGVKATYATNTKDDTKHTCLNRSRMPFL